MSQGAIAVMYADRMCDCRVYRRGHRLNCVNDLLRSSSMGVKAKLTGVDQKVEVRRVKGNHYILCMGWTLLFTTFNYDPCRVLKIDVSCMITLLHVDCRAIAEPASKAGDRQSTSLTRRPHQKRSSPQTRCESSTS